MHAPNSIYSMEIGWNLLVLLKNICLPCLNERAHHVGLLLLSHISLRNILWIIHYEMTVVLSPTVIQIMRSGLMM